MNVKYKRLFNIFIEHQFYKDGTGKHISVVPTLSTKVKLQGAKMLFKSLPTGVTALYKTASNGTDPFIDMGKDNIFRFLLHSSQPAEFFSTTFLDEGTNPADKKYKAGNKVYLTNVPANASTDQNNPETLSFSLLDFTFNPLFTYYFSLAGNPASVLFRLTDSNGNLVSIGKDTNGIDLPTTQTVTKNLDDTFSQQVDLRNKEEGLYTITIRSNGDTSTLSEKKILVSKEALNQGVIGIVDLKYETVTDHIYGDTEQYKILFTRRSSIWKYIVVNKTGSIDLSNPATNLKIEDSLTGGGAPYPVVTFPRDGAEPHASIKIKGFDTVVFKSNAEIPTYEFPKLNIKLLVEQTNKTLYEHLPNPTFSTAEKDNGGSIEKEIFVFI